MLQFAFNVSFHFRTFFNGIQTNSNSLRLHEHHGSTGQSLCVKVTEKLIFKDYNLHLIRFMSLLNVLAMNESLISLAEAFVIIFRSTENEYG